ncbi:MAG: peptidoglycan-binding protein [Alsobacter sp.]
MNSFEFAWLWVARVKLGTAFRAHHAWSGLLGLVVLLGLSPLLGLQPARAEGTGRVALVMLGEEYQKLQKSSIGAKRAADIIEGLQARGFEVIQVANPANSKARAVLLDFSNRTASADVAVAVLIGHSTATGGQSYFLPVNTELGMATDLFSRGISVSSVAQIVARAKAGAVFVLMTAPNFSQPVTGLDARPEFAGDVPKNAVVAFSSSAKVPVSRVDNISEQAAESLAKALQQPSPALAELVKAAASEAGVVFGTPPDISLGKPVPPPPPAPVAAAPAAPAAPAADVKAQEEKVRADADKRAREEQARADAAQTELLKAQKAQSDAARAQAEAEKAKAQADAQRAQADAARALAEAEKAKAQADAQRAQAEAARAQAQADAAKAQAEAEKARAEAARTAAASAAAPPIDEKVLGQRQRQRIQERLRDMSLYTGPIDSIMGPLTREAIMGYQRSRGAAVTGYLTPDQFQTLVPEASQN